MRRTEILVLMMLIGGYEAARAQDVAEMEEAVEMETATKDFLGLEWGAGIGVMGSFGGDRAVEKASIDANKIVRVDEEGDLRPQLFLEMHVFLGGKRAAEWRKYQRWKSAGPMAKARNLTRRELLLRDPKTDELLAPEPPLMGFGPFIALQSSDNKAIDALSLGIMWGFRKDPQESASLNVGIGLAFDPSVQVLGDGMKEGVSTSEEAVRFKKEGRFGWALMASFTF